MPSCGADATLEFAALDVIGRGLDKRFETLLGHLRFARVALAFEEGDAWKAKVNRLFAPLRMLADGIELPIDKYFVPKRAAEPGMEIADFIAHAVGGAARENNLQRRDFRAVFDVPKERRSFMLVQSAVRDPSGPARRDTRRS